MEKADTSGYTLHSELTPFLLAGLTFLLSVAFLRWRRAKTYDNLPPRGPREWPVLGSLLSLAGDDPPHQILANLSKKYGAIFGTQLGSFYTVVLSDYAAIRDAFTRSGDDFSDRPKITMIEHLSDSGKGIIAGYFDSVQTEQRRFTLSALRSLGMGKFRMEESIVDEIQQLAKSFVSRKSQPFVPFHDITVSVSNIICWLNFGKRFQYEDEDFKNVLKAMYGIVEITEIGGAVNFLPFLRFLPASGLKKCMEYRKTFDNYLQPLTLRIKDAFDLGTPSCFIHMYANQMHAAELENPGNHTFSKFNLQKAVADLFVAGTETTSTTLKWALLYMIINEDKQRKVQEELDRVIGRDRMPSLRDRSDLPYTEATLLEIQRKATIVPLGVPRATVRDTVLHGYDIPKGTVILPNLWAVHHDPAIWDNPDQFSPERFLDPRTNRVIQREELIPFSIGKRKCLGEQLAKVELFLFYTHLLHRFHFKLPEGAPKPSMRGKSLATFCPYEYELCAIPRDTQV